MGSYTVSGREIAMIGRRCMALLTILSGLLLWSCAAPTLNAGSQQWPPYESEGTVIGVLPDQGLVLLDHEPIQAPGFFMGQMEMPFSVSNPGLLNGLKTGDRLHFRVSELKKSEIVELRKIPK
jgi:Cu/Ag efflux protein CusF